MGRIDLMIKLERRGEESDKGSKSGIQSSQMGSLPESDDDDDDDHENDQVAEIYKHDRLYLAARNGIIDEFKMILNLVSASDSLPHEDILLRSTPAGNTFLHVAVKHGKQCIVTCIASMKPHLVLSRNSNGETALHLAAKAGDVAIVKLLLPIHRNLLLSQPEGENNNLLRARNNRGNTALHEALFNGWNNRGNTASHEALSKGLKTVAHYLINEDPELLYYQNKDGESALYLAVKAGFVDCVSKILRSSTDEQRLNQLFSKKSPIQAAVRRNSREVLRAMLKMKPSLIKLRDGEGRTPLHYAASLGYHKMVDYLRKLYAQNAFVRDKSGSFPIHLASIKGHVEVISLLLKNFPDPGELLDREGRNILHTAAMNGRSNVVKFVLENPDLEDFINMKDKHGNTPLHLATIHWHPKIVHTLTWDKRVNIKVSNHRGMTALDVADNSMSYNPQFTERLTWAALKAAGTPRFLSSKPRRMSTGPDVYKERVNTLLLVSTLVATVTFAAGFTVPGGYNSSESDVNIGMATLLREKGFHIFVFCDTIAMYSSIIVAVSLIWAQLGDLALVLIAITLAVPLLGIALGMMSIAFTAGVFMVVSKLRWLACAVLFMGITFAVILLLFLLPLCTPLTSRNRVLRYLSYYPFCLMILASSS